MAEIVPVPKKGDLSLIQNYRPISLLENLRKLYEKCLMEIVKNQMRSLSQEQGGFRSGRSTLDTALILHDEHVAYRIILLLDNPTSDEMRVLEQSLMERYGQQLSAVGLAAAQSVAALDRLVRAANADD